MIGGMIHTPPPPGVGQRQNLRFISLWRLTGNDLRYPQIDIAILCDLHLTPISGKSTELRLRALTGEKSPIRF